MMCGFSKNSQSRIARTNSGDLPMDKEKMAEGRRLALEKRRREAAEEQAEEERLEEEARVKEAFRQTEEEKRKLDPATIKAFETLRAQIKTFYEEISILSKKSPDGPLNKFKLKFLNDVLIKVTVILGEEYRPFPDFEAFTDPDLPSASDAALILSHYLSSMSRYYDFHTYKVSHMEYKWHTKGADPIDA